MGSRGPLAKTEGRVRQKAPTAQAGDARLLPEAAYQPNKRWFRPTQEAYLEYMSSPVANVIDPIDVETVRRLFTYYDLWARLQGKWYGLLEDWAKDPTPRIDDEGNVRHGDPLLGRGSSFQEVVSPILASMRQLESSIRQLEDRLGVTPQARARLGIDISEAAVAAEKAHRLERKERGDHQ